MAHIETRHDESPATNSTIADVGSVRREVWTVLLVGTALHFLVRLWLALPRTGPVVIADEIGYLLNARSISGGPAGDLATTTFYRGGYSLLIAPLFEFGLDPVHLYRGVLGVNALLGAAVFPLMWLLLGRVFELTPRSRLAAAFASACTPALFAAGAFATSDAVLPAMVVAFVWVLVRLCQAPPSIREALPWITLFAVVSAWMWTTHARGQLTVMVVISLVVGLQFLRSGATRRTSLFLAVVLTGVLVLAGMHLNDHLASTIYSRAGGGLPSFAAIFDAQIRPAIGAAAGQVWSLLVTTGGLAMIGLVVLWRRSRELLGDPSLAVGVALAVLGVIAASALGFDGLAVESYSVYGRYADMYAPLLVGIASAGIAARRTSVGLWFGAAAVTVLSALGPALLDPSRADLGNSRAFPVSIVAILSGVAPSADVLLVDTSLVLPTIVTVAFASLMGILTKREPGAWRSSLLAPLASSAMVVGSVACAVVGYSLDDHYYPTGRSVGSLPDVATANVVVWDRGPASDRTLRFVFEFSTGHEMVQFDSSVEPPPAGDVLITSAQYEPPPGWVLVGPVPEVAAMVMYRWSE